MWINDGLWDVRFDETVMNLRYAVSIPIVVDRNRAYIRVCCVGKHLRRVDRMTFCNQ